MDLILICWVDTLAPVQQLNGLLGALVGVDLHAFIASDSVDDSWRSLASSVVEAALSDLSRWQLTVAVRVLRFILVQQPLLIWILHHVQGLLLAAGLAMLLRQHGHFVRIGPHLLALCIVVNDRFHRLLVILASIVAVQVVALNVDHGGALTELAPYFIYFIFVEAWRSIIWLHLGEAAALFTRLRYGSFSVLILELDAGLLQLFV